MVMNLLLLYQWKPAPFPASQIIGSTLDTEKTKVKPPTLFKDKIRWAQYLSLLRKACLQQLLTYPGIPPYKNCFVSIPL